jgi:phosphoribosylaminoimidazole-succinocarboxamide synthase
MRSTDVDGIRIYEGKAKVLFETGERDAIVQSFKDDATAFNALKKGTILHKGPINCQFSSALFPMLEGKGIPTHFLGMVSPNAMKIRRLTMVPLEVVMRNRVAGSLVKRLGLAEGTVLSHPVLEWYYKRDDLGDPIVNRDHIDVLGLASHAVLAEVERLARKTNDILVPFFATKDILLVDMKLEFGTDMSGKVFLADEISGDTCRFWDAKTLDKMDKDRFRQDLGQVEEHYIALFRRVVGHDPEI